MHIFVVGKQQRFIDSRFISCVRPVKCDSIRANMPPEPRKMLGLTIDGQETLFPIETPGLDKLLNHWYGEEWATVAAKIHWEDASFSGLAPYVE